MERAGSLHGVRVGAGSGPGLEGGLRWSAHSLGGVECRGHAQYIAFVLRASKVVVGYFCCCCILLFIICPNCPRSYFGPLLFPSLCCSIRDAETRSQPRPVSSSPPFSQLSCSPPAFQNRLDIDSCPNIKCSAKQNAVRKT